MKRSRILFIISLIALFLKMIIAGYFFVSCDKADPLPPLNQAYPKEFVLPDPLELTSDERDYLDDLQQEYELATE